MLDNSEDKAQFKAYTQTLPWNQILRFLYKLRHTLLLYGIYTLGQLKSASHKHVENSFGTNYDRKLPSGYADLAATSKIIHSTSHALAHTCASAKLNSTNTTIEGWFDDLPVGRRNKVQFYGGEDATDDFIVTVSPIIGDMREALLITVVDDKSAYGSQELGFGITSYIMHFIRDLADTMWLAKTIYFLVLRDGNEMNSGVKRFIDWYQFDTNPPLRNYAKIPISKFRREKLERHGIIRQSLGLVSFPENQKSLTPPMILSNKVGVRNSNLDFVSQSIWAIRSTVLPLEQSISKEINNSVRDLSNPHVYLQTLLIDSLTIQPTSGFDHESRQAIMKGLQLLLRGLNEMVLSFHHLSSQYWLDPETSKKQSRYTPNAVTIETLLFAFIAIVVALTVDSGMPVALTPVDGADFRVWLSRQQLFSPISDEFEDAAADALEGGTGPLRTPAAVGTAAEQDSSLLDKKCVEQNLEDTSSISGRSQEQQQAAESKIFRNHSAQLKDGYYMLLGDWASGYMVIASITNGITPIIWQISDFGLRSYLLPRQNISSAYGLHLTCVICLGAWTYFLAFTSYDLFARKYVSPSDKLSSLKIARLYAQIAAKAVGFSIVVLLVQLIALQPALGLLSSIIIAIMWLLPPPLDLSIIAGLIVSEKSADWFDQLHGFWRFSSIFASIDWKSLLQNTLRPYGLTGEITFTVFNSLVTLIALLIIRSVTIFLLGNFLTRIKQSSTQTSPRST